MSDTIAVSSPPKKRRRWLRWLAWSSAILLVLIVAIYFVATSSAFLKAVILPRVGSALNATVTVSDASIHPFSGIVLDDLKVQPNGQSPLVTASEVRVSYHLFDILGGNLHVDEIALVSPTVELVQNPDGSSNLGTLLKALSSKSSAATKPATTSAASKPLQIDLGKLTLTHATILQIKNYADGRSDFAGLTNVNVTLTNLKNGQTAKLELAADIRVENNSTNSSGSLAAALKGGFSCAFTPDMKPGSASGSLNLSVSQAGGAFGDLENFTAVLDCDVTPTEIKQLALHFQQAGSPLGELAVTGPFDAEKMEGKLSVVLHGIDRRLLNLVGEKSGLDFGTTQIDCTNEIELAKAGASITAAGRFDADKVQVTRAGQTTPTLNFSAAYAVTVNRTAQSATMRSLNLTGTQNGAPLLSAMLASPMTVGLGGGASSLGDAVLDVAVTNLKLADWKPFLGNLANPASGSGGIDFDTTEINSTNEIQLAKAGAAITATGKFNVDKLQLTRAGQTTPSLDLSADYDITLDRTAQSATLRSLNLTGTQNGALLLNAQLTSPMSVSWGSDASGMGDAALDLAVTGLNLADWQPFLGNIATAGKVGLKLKVTSHQGGKQIGFDLNTDVANLAAHLGSNQISSAEITLAAHGQ
ncbi:MAG TPA: AsmA family protein, partial [Candidatus Paceibacterota bacterium]|nr:AsmA family protein [Candidatus Paceibacterota bacterium]